MTRVAINEEPVKIECENVCQVTIVVISFNASDVCNSNGSVNCNQKELDSKIPGANKKNPGFVPRIIGTGPIFPVVVTYWILDPAGNGSYTKCDEFDSYRIMLFNHIFIRIIRNRLYDIY